MSAFLKVEARASGSHAPASSGETGLFGQHHDVLTDAITLIGAAFGTQVHVRRARRDFDDEL